MISPLNAVLGMLLNAQLIAPLPRVPLPQPAANVARATTHQNRVPAGRRVGTVQRIAIDVLESAWRPEGVDDPEVPILAFAEAGKGPTVPARLDALPRDQHARVLPLRRAVGETHRLPLIGIHPDWLVSFTLQNDSTVARWRAIAKDGADLPPGRWTFEIRSVEPVRYVPLTLIVEPKKTAP